MDSIVAQMARNRFRFHGTREFPIVVRAPYGGGTHTPEMHADNLEGLMAQTPGLRVAMPLILQMQKACYYQQSNQMTQLSSRKLETLPLD